MSILNSNSAASQSSTTSERRVPLTEAEAIAAEAAGSGDSAVNKPFAAYRHRNVRRFSVGRFDFVNHLLFVYSEAENEEFLDLWETLESRDHHAIVKYDFEAAANVETAVVRGGVNSSDAKDGKVISA